MALPDRALFRPASARNVEGPVPSKAAPVAGGVTPMAVKAPQYPVQREMPSRGLSRASHNGTHNRGSGEEAGLNLAQNRRQRAAEVRQDVLAE